MKYVSPKYEMEMLTTDDVIMASPITIYKFSENEAIDTDNDGVADITGKKAFSSVNYSFIF